MAIQCHSSESCPTRGTAGRQANLPVEGGLRRGQRGGPEVQTELGAGSEVSQDEGGITSRVRRGHKGILAVVMPC